MEFFSRAENYSKMLAKIAAANFVGGLIAVSILRSEIQLIDRFASQIAVNGKVFGFDIPLGTVVIAFAFALTSRVIKLHDRVSDFVRLRHRFDLNEILFPMAQETLGDTSAELKVKIATQRRKLMTKVFYKYVSSSPGKAQIDPHLIHAALDQWTWFWCILEADLVFIAAGLILLSRGQSSSGWYMILGVAFTVPALVLIYNRCAKYAEEEIEAILVDQNRKWEVEGVFRAL